MKKSKKFILGVGYFLMYSLIFGTITTILSLILDVIPIEWKSYLVYFLAASLGSYLAAFVISKLSNTPEKNKITIKLSKVMLIIYAISILISIIAVIFFDGDKKEMITAIAYTLGWLLLYATTDDK